MVIVLQSVLFAMFPFALVYAAVSDLLTMTISNRLTVALAVGFVVLAPLTGMDVTSLALHGAAGLAMLAITFSLFSFGWIGGGDAKLAAAIALWFGWAPQTIEFVALSSVFGGILTLGILGFRELPLPAFAVRPIWVQRLHDTSSGIPYGVALAAGGLAVYSRTEWANLLSG